MPFLAPVIPLLTAIGTVGGAAVAGTELGMNLAGVGQPSSGDAKKQADAAALKQANTDAETKRKMLLAALPGAQEQSGGALEAPSLLNLGSIIAGLPGEANQGAGRSALSSFLGAGSSGSPNTPQDTLVGSTYGLSGSQG